MIKKLLDNFIKLDKYAHFVTAALLSLTLIISGGSVAEVLIFLGFCITLKEGLDAYQPNNKWDWYDFAAGWAGVATAYFIYAISNVQVM